MTKFILPSAALAALFIAGSAQADTVEIYLVDMLDNTQNGYCIDISGGQGSQADPDNGLQGHTCYSPSGEIFVDQGFDSAQFSEGTLYMPEFDVCASVAAFEAGAAIGLAECDGSAAQSFSFTDGGTITPASDTGLCMTVGADTRNGRSDTNQIKALSLETCSDDQAASQTWSSRGVTG
ncbi:ricin-type beta-trefoil lectin domain protein [Pararhodobacter oceanensis]|uniref:ricin-type beta-trefoil lectin domain protein n=1 Tax=Pararhodobacter oceanensis TaxID=2172121 RepID=UPI003A934CF5